MRRVCFLLLPVAMLLTSCCCNNTGDSYWGSDSAWYKNTAAPDTNFVDVFYIASTDVIKSTDHDGNEVYRANLTPLERALIKKELDYVNRNYYPDSVNMFAPYTHQYTLDAVLLPKESFDFIAADVAVEVCEAFDYYMENFNGGRPFIIAGFSQGGQMTREILKHITDEQYSRMVAAYSIGYGISAEDLQCQHIKPAQSATDTGVTISYNSVADLSNIWEFVQNDAVVCINPVNWSVKADTAVFLNRGEELAVILDTINNVLIVNGFEEESSTVEVPWPKGNLHHYDLLFYAPMIKKNTLERAKNF